MYISGKLIVVLVGTILIAHSSSLSAYLDEYDYPDGFRHSMGIVDDNDSPTTTLSTPSTQENRKNHEIEFVHLMKIWFPSRLIKREDIIAPTIEPFTTTILPGGDTLSYTNEPPISEHESELLEVETNETESDSETTTNPELATISAQGENQALTRVSLFNQSLESEQEHQTTTPELAFITAQGKNQASGASIGHVTIGTAFRGFLLIVLLLLLL